MRQPQVSPLSGDLWFSWGEDGNKKLIKVGKIATAIRSVGMACVYFNYVLKPFQGVSGSLSTFLQTNT